jgi:hypothetical protein
LRGLAAAAAACPRLKKLFRRNVSTVSRDGARIYRFVHAAPMEKMFQGIYLLSIFAM